MAKIKNNPGCNASGNCGCGSCDIASDPFDRADDLDVNNGSPCGWSEPVDGWEVYSNTAASASDGSRMICSQGDGGTVSVSASVRFKGSDADGVQLILKYKDANNYWYAQVTVGTGATLKIKKVVSGTTTELATTSITWDVDTWGTLKFCYGGGYVWALAFASSVYGTSASVTTDITDQQYAGLESIVSDIAWCDDFTFQKTQSPCTACVPYSSCTECAGGSVPAQIDITLPSDWADAGSCACSGINGSTYTLTGNTDWQEINLHVVCVGGPSIVSAIVAPNPCYYESAGLIVLCSTRNIAFKLRIFNTAAGTCRIEIWIGITGGLFTRGYAWYYAIESDSPFDLSTPIEVPFWYKVDTCGADQPDYCAFLGNEYPVTIQAH